MSKKKACCVLVMLVLCFTLIAEIVQSEVGWLLSSVGARNIFGRNNGFLGPTFGLIGYFAAPAKLGAMLGLAAGPVGAIVGFGVGSL